MRLLPSFLAASVLSLAAAAPAGAAPTWLTPVTLSPQSTGEVQRAVIASDGAGHLAAAWMKQTGSAPLRYTAQLALRSPGGGFSEVINVSQESEQTLAVDVAVDGSGTATVVWDQTVGGVSDVKAMRVMPDGTKTGVQTLAAAGDEPRVAVNASGAAVATWRELSQIHAAVRGATTDSFTDVGAISGTASMSIKRVHDVVIDPAGNAVAAWIRDNTKVEANRRPAGGAFNAPAAAETIENTGDADNLVLAMAPGGQATAMWTRLGLNPEIRTAERTPTPSFAAGGWNAADRASPIGQKAQNASVALDAQNTAIAIWENTTIGKVEAGIRPSGGSFSGFAPLSGSAGGAFASQVDVAPDGAAVAIWRGSSGGKPAIQAVRRAPSGEFGGVTDIAIGDPAADPAVEVFNPSVAVDAEGNAGAVWSRFRNGTGINDWRLDAAGFDAAPPAFAAVSVPASGSVGAGIGMAAAATDRWSPFSLAWNFGDGTSAPGDAVTHAFGAPGPFSVTVSATDAVGNAASATRPVAIAAPTLPPRTPRINSPVSVLWAKNSTRIFLLRMKIRRVPKGGKAELRCRGRKCPFRRKASTKRRKGAITLFKDMNPNKAVQVKNRTFRGGQRLQLRITAPGHIGKVVKYRLRSGRFPVGVQFCLPLGSTKPQKRC